MLWRFRTDTRLRAGFLASRLQYGVGPAVICFALCTKLISVIWYGYVPLRIYDKAVSALPLMTIIVVR